MSDFWMPHHFSIKNVLPIRLDIKHRELSKTSAPSRPLSSVPSLMLSSECLLPHHLPKVKRENILVI